MKKSYRYLLFLFALLFLSVRSYSQVSVTLFPSPAKQFFIDDLWKTFIVNPSTSPLSAYVQLVIRDNTGSSILSVTTQVQNFAPGVNHLTAAEGLSGRWVYGSSSASYIMQQTGALPYGAYTFCANVYSLISKPLGSDCEERDVEPLLPPVLSYPNNKEVINTVIPILVWIPPRPLTNILVDYNLRLCEVQSGQTPAEALLQSPPLLNLSGLTTNTLNYPVSAPALEVGHEYAWQVAASYESYNLGETDIWVFRVKPPDPIPPDPIIYPFASRKSDSKFYITHGIFRFAYNNKENEKKLTYNITRMDAKKAKLSGLPDEQLKPGTNKMQLDLKNNPGLKDNTYYTLEVSDDQKVIYKVLFLYLQK